MRLAANANDVRRVATTGAFGVVSMDGAAFDRGDGRFDKARFVQGVSMDGHRHVVVIGDTQAAIYGGRRGAPVLMELQADGAAENLFLQSLRQGGVAFASEAKIQRQGIGRLQHPFEIKRARRTGGGASPGGRPSAAAHHGGQSGSDGLMSLLRADEMNVRVDPAGGKDQPLTGDHFRGHPDYHAFRDSGHDIGIACLADPGNQAVLDAHIGFVNARVVHHKGVGNDTIQAIRLAHASGLALAFADGFAAAKFALVAVDRVVALDLQEERSVAEPDAIARGRAEHLGVMLAFHEVRHGGSG